MRDRRTANDDMEQPTAGPTVEERVTKLFMANHRRINPALHTNPDMAASRFIRLIEKQMEGEPEKAYADRVMDCARKFVGLTHAEQETVVTGMRDGCPWRGDDMKFYVRVLGETERMREMGIEAYKREALQMLRGALGGRHGA